MKPINSLPPFKRLCVTIGNLPSSYVDSMSYYECLMWLCKYLKDTVIPAVNENAEAVNELINWFNNLDVQDEIDKKLDEMVEDGTLTTLIGAYVDPIYQEYETSINKSINTFENNVNRTLNEFEVEVNNATNTVEAQNITIGQIENKVNSLSSGAPAGIYASLSDLQTADPDHDKIYLTSNNGNWYYYDTSNSTWTSGGVYQSSGLGESVINGLNFDTTLRNSLYVRKPALTLNNGYIAPNGTIQSNDALRYTDLIKLNKDETVFAFCSGGSSSNSISIISVFDGDENFLNDKVTNSNGNIKTLYSYKSSSNNTYIRLSYLLSNGIQYYIIKSVKETDENINTKLNNVTETRDITPTFNNGDYIDTNNNIVPNTILTYTNPIKLNAGETVIFKGAGIRNVVNIISTCNQDKSNIKGVSISIDSDIHEYSYTTNVDTYIMISAVSSKFGELYITKNVNDDLKNLKNTLFTSFIKFGVIGDSLASGECISNEGSTTHYNDLYDYSWGQFIARNHGMECINFAKGGLTTRSWLTDSHGLTKLLQDENKCNSYIIGLGTNDVSTLGANYLGTILDVNVQDFTQNADTYYGNYARIIGYIKQVQPKAKIFALTNPKESGELYTQFNQAIKDIATLYDNVYVIDLQDDYLSYFTSGFIYKNVREGHYNAIAYNYIGELLFNIINNYMLNNYDEFEQVEFIGTEHSYN